MTPTFRMEAFTQQRRLAAAAQLLQNTLLVDESHPPRSQQSVLSRTQRLVRSTNACPLKLNEYAQQLLRIAKECFPFAKRQTTLQNNARRPCSDFIDMLRRLTNNCRFIRPPVTVVREDL